ncbi:hypothetical protein V6N13_059074 [Hibiscus sabdariffa]
MVESSSGDCSSRSPTIDRTGDKNLDSTDAINAIFLGRNNLVNGNKEGLVTANSLGADDLNRAANCSIEDDTTSINIPEVFTPYNDIAYQNENVVFKVELVDNNENVENNMEVGLHEVVVSAKGLGNDAEN